MSSPSGRPKALMAAVNQWTSPFQIGAHHIARCLVAAGWDVAFISTPVSPFHLGALTPEVRGRLNLYGRGGLTDLGGHLWAYVPGALLVPRATPPLRSRWIHHHWPRLTVPNLVRTAQQHGFGEVDLLYVDAPVHEPWLGSITYRKSVFRLADRMAGFRAFNPEMGVLARRVASNVDLVAYTARSLEPDVDHLAPRRRLYLPNGVDFARFSAASAGTPPDLASIPRPIAIYVGTLDEWFDFDTVNALAEGLPDVSFVLIGPEDKARTRLGPRSNLHLLGRRPYQDIPAYLQAADLGLIPFDVHGHRALVDSIHPLKLYEYLAAGLPVVAADWEELRLLDSPAFLCRTADDYVAAVRRAITSPPDRATSIAFARAADWRGRVDQLLDALELPVGRTPESASPDLANDEPAVHEDVARCRGADARNIWDPPPA